MPNTKNELTKKPCNVIMTEKKYKRKCKCCGVIKTTNSYEWFIRSADKLCRSCTNSINAGGSGNTRIRNNRKQCFKCKKSYPLSEFVTYSNGKTHSYCNGCKKESFRHYQKTVGRFKRYGITKQEYENLEQSQKHCCAGCGIQTELHIDHCHTSKKIRGLLCFNCNLALGLLADEISTLKNLINYLENKSDESVN